MLYETILSFWPGPGTLGTVMLYETILSFWPGPGTLGTVMLCETILSFLPSGSFDNQPYQMLKVYDIAPISTLHLTKKIDLRRFATTRNGILYIRKPHTAANLHTNTFPTIFSPCDSKYNVNRLWAIDANWRHIRNVRYRRLTPNGVKAVFFAFFVHSARLLRSTSGLWLAADRRY